MATRRKKGYKVIDRYGYSCVMHQDVGGVKYIVGIKTRRQTGCGPLAVFSHKRVAIGFADSNRIFRCSYVPSTDTDLWTIATFCHRELPSKTVLADEVTILGESIREGA